MAKDILPKAKPQLARAEIEKILNANKVPKGECAIVGIRGFYLESMGLTNANDRKIYDDALFIITPNAFASFNGNVDPNGTRKGSGTGSKKGMANLATGVWKYQKGIHRGYQAFTQAGKVTVIRDGEKGDYPDTGYFGINIHRGGLSTTSSLGCQTVPPSQWDSFKGLMYGELSRNNQKTFSYILIDETKRRKGELNV